MHGNFFRIQVFGRAWLQPCRNDAANQPALAAEVGFSKPTSGAKAHAQVSNSVAQLKLCPSEIPSYNASEQMVERSDCRNSMRGRSWRSLAVCFLLLTCIRLPAQTATSPLVYDCAYTKTPLRIDGRLDDAAWRAAPWTSDFIDIQGSSMPKPRFRTRAKMLWDDKYLYIAAELEEPDVHGTLTEHDSVIFHDDDFEVFVKPLPDTPSYYEFEMNALNTGWDLYLAKPYLQGGKADNSWDIAGLKTAVAVQGTLNKSDDTDRGWTLEIAYPLSAFEPRQHVPAPVDGTTWRINFSRVEWKAGQKNEDNWVWSPQGVINMHVPEQWGNLRFRKP